MRDQTERQTLNRLIELCRDGERGFRHAANHVQDPVLKTLFLEIATQRERIVEALRPHAQRLGGDADSDGTTTGALHRGWMSLKDTLVPHEDAAIVKEAERGERAALAAFEEAIAGILPPESRELIESCYAQVQHSCRRIAALQAVAAGAGRDR
ncbi:MAG TPA: PA2169 family four-helix-bundle protein [Vicinamibacterales bacterium]|jgi:uncharacterized protein (TIGR02284 family)|nr:PA2169 family four-helix-bundle protein [Vicinamibacterales bacterium]